MEEVGTKMTVDMAQLVAVALRRINHAVDLRSRFLMMRHGVSAPQLATLQELSRRSSLSIGELTRAVHLSQSTMTGILDRLERRGLVRRERSPEDKRRSHVRLTEAGDRLLAEAPPLLHEEFIRRFNNLADWEQTQILSTLQRVVSMMEPHGIEPTVDLAEESAGLPTEQPQALLD